ncbi:hypothetical protein UFOVP1655_224 [uncultured Caudovirales phage]|uniref:Uncharacterized protein n=1 Tax=uncultured Caudovirales phage TaxID=2100421 RepID=A0A6J5T6W6_9CAUD|nr:hypothetical protein UFOVP1655_224 [uncultured Caudovirales phage]
MSGIKLSQLQELTSIDVTSNDILLLACDETGPYTSATISLNTLYNSFNISSTTANTGNYSFSSNTISNAAGMLLDTGRGVLAIGTDMEAPGVPTHFHIAFQNSNAQIIDRQLFLGDDYNYVNVGQYNGVNISAFDRVAEGAQSKTWNFGKTGDLSLPVDGGIVFDRNNTSIRVGMGFHIASGEGISLEAIDQTDPDNLVYKGWYFNPDGSLTLPGTIVHSTNSIGIGGISRVAAVTLDVTKSIHKLTSGWYYLPDGIEGQLTYLTLATGSTPLDIKVDFQHARLNESANAPYDNGPIFSNVFGNAYDVSANARPPSLVTAIFIDGAWVCSPDGVWD